MEVDFVSPNDAVKKLIVNADDLGYASGVNEGIIKAYREGIVTSTSLMVYGQTVRQGVKLANENPRLGLGLHFQLDKEEWMLLRQLKKAVSVAFIEKTKKEFLNQIVEFKKLTGKMPDHIDSHHHVHRLPRIYHFVRSFCKENTIPFRGQINFIDNFFGMPTTRSLTADNLAQILARLPDGPSEIMCHPGFVSPDMRTSYSSQREIELGILTSPQILEVIKREKIRLINWQQT